MMTIRHAGSDSGGLAELDQESLVALSGGNGGGVARAVYELGSSAARHIGNCISHNWNTFKACFRKELNK